MADNQDDEIGRRINSTMMVHGLPANVALVDRLQEGAKEASLTAVWAATAKAAPYSLRTVACGKSTNVGHEHYRFHLYLSALPAILRAHRPALMWAALVAPSSARRTAALA